MNTPALGMAVITLVLLGLIAPASAENIPALVDMPTAVAASNPDLVGRRATLMQERAKLHAKTDNLNAQCAAVVEGSAAAVSCTKRQTLLLSSLHSHIQRSNDFNAAAQAAIQTPIVPDLANDPDTAKFCAAKLRVAADERAIQQMNLGNDARSFEMFADASDAEKAKFEEKMRGALLDQALEATTIAAKSASSLNPWNVNTKIGELQAMGLSNDGLFAGLRKIAATKDKPAMAQAYKELVEGVQKWKEADDTKKGMQDDTKNAHLRLLLGVLKIAQGNAELGLVVTAVDLGESLAYLHYMSPLVDDLTKITDDKLVLLKGRIDRLKTDVSALNTAKRARTTKSEKSGEPDCRT